MTAKRSRMNEAMIELEMKKKIYEITHPGLPGKMLIIHQLTVDV